MFRRVLPLLLLVFLPSLSLAAPLPKKEILYINSYQNGYGWSDEIMEGVRNALADQDAYSIDLQIEFLDSKKHYDQTIKQLLYELYKYKFKDERFDIIIVSDNVAFDFILEYGEELFPGTPVVFCGVNDLKDGALSGRNNITGVLENFDLRSNLELVAALHPKAKRMIVVGDRSVTSQAIANQVREQLKEWREPLTVEYWEDFSLDEILRRVETLPSDSFLFFIPFYKGKSGRTLSANEVMRAIADHSEIPIYSAWQFLVGGGMVGGKVLSGYQQGELAAGMALQILSGVSPSSIPIIKETKQSYVFDYNALKRHGINESRLPPGSEIENKPYYFFRLDPHLFWTIIAAASLLTMAVLFLAINIARRRRAEERIRSQLDFLQLLLDNLPQLVFWKDNSLRYVGANKAFARFFQIADPSEVMGKTNAELMPDWWEYVEMAEKLDREAIATGKPRQRVRWSFRNRQGEPSWLEMTKAPLRDERGRIVGVLSLAEDVTGKEMLEEQLRQAQKFEALGALAGGLAHDFNNILTSIINSTELALLDIPEDSRTAEDLRRALRASRRGSGLARQLLTYSRPSREGFRSVDLRPAVREALGLFRASLPGNVRLVEDIAETPVMCLADPDQIHQVLMNLCANAWQALRGASGTIKVGLSLVSLSEEECRRLALPEGVYAHIVVEDDGPGIAPEIMDKIFDPFFTSRRREGGTGLGLAVVYGAVRNHGGSITAASGPGQGAAFSIHLPCAKESLEPLGADEPAPKGRGERILFVEDDPSQLELIPRILANAGYAVRTAENAAQALKILETAEKDASGRAFDLVVTDFDMPGKTGFELADILLERAPDMPVLVVTGRTQDMAAARRPENVREILLKPYDSRSIAAAIRRVLDGGEGAVWPAS